jgi:hypothetical protein
MAGPVFKRSYFAIQSEHLQKLINDFTLAGRAWTAYPADKLETILKYNKAIPDDFRYAYFEPNQNAVIFVGPAELTNENLPDGFQLLDSNDKFMSAPISKGTLIDLVSGKELKQLPKGEDNGAS